MALCHNLRLHAGCGQSGLPKNCAAVSDLAMHDLAMHVAPLAATLKDEAVVAGVCQGGVQVCCAYVHTAGTAGAGHRD